MNCYRKRLCQRIELPDHIKDTLRGPDDEESWPRLELLRRNIVRCILGERSIRLDEESAADVAGALERSRPGRCIKQYVDEIGPECRHAPEGSRLLVTVRLPRRGTLADSRAATAAAVRKLVGEAVPVHTRPLGTIREPPADDFAAMLLRDPKSFTLRGLSAELSLSKPAVLDKMLLVLWDALFLDQCETWVQQEVTNLPADETPELARWFLKGLAVGDTPLFDGMCLPLL